MINIIGNIIGSSGYCQHTRSLANALFKQTQTRLTTYIPPGFEKELNDQEIEMLSRKPEKDEWNLIIDLPYNWKMHIKGEKNIGFLIWEGDKIPKSFMADLEDNRIKYIFCPSKHTYDAIKKTYEEYDPDAFLDLTEPGKDKLKIVPHGVDLSLFYQNSRNPNEPFTFLCNKGFRNEWDRGGIQFAVQAYLEEFKKNENVLLRLKINPAYGNYITEYLNKKCNLNSPNIYLDMAFYPFNKLREIYKGDVFLALSRAESYHLGCIEAMSCGLPVITTDFGGQTDYCNKDNSWLIPGELVDVKNEMFYEEIKWSNPNIKELRKAMREAFEDRKLIEIKSKNALETAKQNTWDLTAHIIINLLK